MTYKAITGTIEQIDEILNTLAIQVDQDGCKMFQINIHWKNEELFTLVWVPVVKKERRQPSMKKLNEKAIDFDLMVQKEDNGYIVRNQYSNQIVAMAKTAIGIQRKLTAVTNKIQMDKVEKILNRILLTKNA